MSNLSRSNLALHCSRTLFDVDSKNLRLEEVDRELSLPETWENQEKVKELSQERSRLDRTVGSVLELRQALVDASEYLELAAEESDQDALDELADDLDTTEHKLGELEFQRMFDGETDASHAFIDIQFGEGGTEAQDWANMLLRMYIKWCELKRAFTAWSDIHRSIQGTADIHRSLRSTCMPKLMTRSKLKLIRRMYAPIRIGQVAPGVNT